MSRPIVQTLGMGNRSLTQELRKRGWQTASISGTEMLCQCTKIGCRETASVSLKRPEELPAPCTAGHINGYDERTFELYRGLVADLRHNQRQLGLSQEDLNAIIGTADGYVNKLESLARVATFPTMALWVQSLGLSITTTPTPLPKDKTRKTEISTQQPRKSDQG